MTPPIPLQRIPKRKRPIKPATVRALFWAIAVPCIAVFCAGAIAMCTTPVFPM